MKFFHSLKLRAIVLVWNHTPNCAEMSRLASQSLDKSLSLNIRLQVKLHFLICAWCKRYTRQLRFLHESAPHFEEHAGQHLTRGLSAEAKQRIVQHLRHSL